jgi:hypothetical protein
MATAEDQIVEDFMAHRIEAEEMVRRLAALRPAPPRVTSGEPPVVSAALERAKAAIRRINACC